MRGLPRWNASFSIDGCEYHCKKINFEKNDIYDEGDA